MVIYCNKCGRILVENADFCHYCGNKLDGFQIEKKDQFINQTNKKSDVKSIERPIGLLVFPIIDFFITLKIPVIGFIMYFLMIISNEVEASGGFLASNEGSSGLGSASHVGMSGSGVPVLPEYFEMVYFGILVLLIIIHIITAFCFITGKKWSFKIAYIRLIVPMVSFIVLLSIVIFENIQPMLFLVVFITVPSLIVGALILIYFYLKKNDIKKYLGLV